MHLVVLVFIGVRSYKHTIYCATKLVFPYVFSFVFRIARSRAVWVTVIFKARLYLREIYFHFVLSKRWIRREYYVSHGIHWPCIFHFHYVTNEIVLCKYFSRSYCHKFICNFPSISCGFGQLKWILKLFFWKRIQRCEGKLNTCWNKQKHARPCRGKTPTVLKLAVDNVKLALCDSRDFCIVLYPYKG